MWTWYKKRQSSAHDVPKGCEHYFLSIGGIYMGRVESILYDDPAEWPCWSAYVYILENQDGGIAGGDLTRDEGMAHCEERIGKLMAQITNGPIPLMGRVILDPLWQPHPVTGELWQPILP